MGQLIDFYAGDAEAIGRAFDVSDHDTLGELQKGPLHVDFSLNLSPIDFDLLTEAAQAIVGSGPTSLIESLERQVGGDGDERSADVLSRDWVRMMASLDDSRLDALLARWLEGMADEHSGGVAGTPDLRHALRDLLALCREAAKRDLAIVHTWSL